MLKDIMGIKLQGANFTEETSLKLFTTSSSGIPRVSMIYGKNGSGKSTISRAFNKIRGNEEITIASAELINASGSVVNISEDEAKRIHIFNEEYIDSTIRLREEGLDTIVVLGEQKELEDQINEIKKKQEEEQKKFDNQKKICNEYADSTKVISPEYYTKSIIASLKGNGNWAERDRKIKGNRQASAVRNDTSVQFISRKPVKTRDELIAEFDQKLIEYEVAKSGSKRIDTKVKTDYEFFFNETAFVEVLSRKLEEPNLNEREKFLLGLVFEKGQNHLHGIKEYFNDEDHDVCLYCMQSVNEEHKKKLFMSIDKILSKASEEHQAELDKYHRQEIVISFEPYNDLDKSIIKRCQECLDNFNSTIKIINDNIVTKKENVYKPIKVELTEVNPKFEALKSALVELEKARVEFNTNAADVSSRCIELNEINSDIAYYDIKDDYGKYQVQVQLKEKADQKLKSSLTQLTFYQDELNKLETQKKNIHIAMKSINDSLRYIFFANNRLSIECRNGKYYLLSRGNSVTPQKISVGERNAIALCYFFADIMKNKEEDDVYNKEYLIIIDDPISSFDIENRVGILSYLKYQLQRFLCGNIDTKAVIMTHDIQTFYDIQKLNEEIMYACRGKFGKSPKHIYLINELSDCSLHEFKFKNRNEYTSLMENIFDYAQGIALEYELVIGNSMRRVLEAFSTFVYKKGIDEISINTKIMEGIASPYNTYFEHLMYRLVLNGGSHSEENVKALGSMDFFDCISSDEKKRTAKDLLCFIYLLNNVHILEHLSGKAQVQQTIENWLSDIEISQVEYISIVE